MELLKTYVAPLLCSDRTPIWRHKKPIFWLDELFDGGIRRPESLGRPLIVLISGPPGAGKSLLMQQIAYSRGAQSVMWSPDNPAKWHRSVIVSTEVASSALAENMESMGMANEPIDSNGTRPVWFHDYAFQEGQVAITPQSLPRPVPPVVILGTSPKGQTWEYNELIQNIEGAWRQLGSFAIPEVLAIDSLNVLAEHLERTKERERGRLADSTERERETEREVRSQDRLYKRVLAMEPSPKYFFLVLDSPAISSLLPSAHHTFWEFVADVIIRLDYRHGMHDYLMRHLEIVKARFQPFALGRQLIKIFRNPEVPKDRKIDIDPEGPIPNIERGGIFVFPSEHFVLSKIRSGRPLIDQRSDSPAVAPRSDPAIESSPGAWGPKKPIGSDEINWPAEWCLEMVGSGVPRNMATALIGRRGLHKSYFGYQFLLDGVANGESVLLISFRDNASAIRRTLESIARASQYGSLITPEVIDSQVHIVYQRPGYVSPQELLHRIITAVGEFQPRRALINAVDQWDAGHPLLADSAILLPTLIDFLNTQQVTSMIVGVGGADGELNANGLTSKAETVLLFEQRTMRWKRDGEHCRKSAGEAIDGYPQSVPLRILNDAKSDVARTGVVLLSAIRVPHGRAGLARGVLEYCSVDGGRPAGLKLVPLAPEYPID